MAFGPFPFMGGMAVEAQTATEERLIEMAKELLKLGYYLGFDGPVTFNNAKTVIEVLTTGKTKKKMRDDLHVPQFFITFVG